MTDKKTFGSFIKTKRVEKNYSQKDLAKMLFVTEGAISKWERGVSYPDITLISDICRILEISEHELITATTDMDTRKMRQEARKFRAICNTWFWVPTLSYGIALITCFICNLAVSHTLSWFFVVLSSLVCAFTFIPTVTSFFNTNKLLAFTVSTYLSISLVLFTCAVYTNGLYWFLTAAIGVLMGYVTIFLPTLLKRTNFRRYKYIISFTVVFILTILMMMNISIRQPFMLGNAILMAAYGFLPLIACAAICTYNFNGFLKAGICSAVSGVTLYCTNHVVSALFGPPDNKPYQVNFQNWEQCLSGNIHLIALSFFLFVSAILFTIGFFRVRRVKKQ